MIYIYKVYPSYIFSSSGCRSCVFWKKKTNSVNTEIDYRRIYWYITDDVQL